MKLYVARFYDDETFKFDIETQEWVIAESSDKAQKSPYRVATDNEETAKTFWGTQYDEVDYDDCYEVIDIKARHFCEGWDYSVLIDKPSK
jgi:hypothetical protein